MAFWIASTSSGLFIRGRSRTPRRRATSIRCRLLALASTPPLVGLFVFRPAALRLRRTVEELWDTEDDLRREKAAVERLLAQARRGMTPAPARVVPLEIVKG